MPITRLAPSPTGALHLGNARTFLVNWILARRNGWDIVLRIEDLDGPRIKAGADAQAIEDLRWLGIDWDQGPVYQSQRAERYESAARRLLESGDAYPCVCSRSDIDAAASAPHADDGAAVYPGTCRGRFGRMQQAIDAAGSRRPCIRFKTERGVVQFADDFAGPVEFDAAQQLGDFVIVKSDGTTAYQLAVVVDDAEMDVTHVVRGDDLLESAARQIMLYQRLGLGAPPRYLHLPLVVGSDGKRLAKRHGDTRLSQYRARGVSARRTLALLARWCGVDTRCEEISIDELRDRFALERMPRTRIVMTLQDHQFLCAR